MIQVTPLEQDLIEENEELRMKLYQIETCFTQPNKMRKLGFPVSNKRLWDAIDTATELLKGEQSCIN